MDMKEFVEIFLNVEEDIQDIIDVVLEATQSQPLLPA